MINFLDKCKIVARFEFDNFDRAHLSRHGMSGFVDIPIGPAADACEQLKTELEKS